MLLAVGMTLPMLDASWSTVTLPRFCVWIRTSEICAMLPALLPYALVTVVRISSADESDVKPATASLCASLTALMEFLADTFAEIA